MTLKTPFTPSEFDDTCRELLRQCPWLSETSGHRSKEQNAKVAGSSDSKHLIGMARDFTAKTVEGLKQAQAMAQNLKLWSVVHDVGSGQHLHVQGLKPGPVPGWWASKYMKEKTDVG